MADKKSWLKLGKIPITPQITLKIPTVGEILDNEESYYNLTSSLTASPFSYMVQLDDMGVDYTSIDDWQLFCMFFCSYSNQVVSYKNKIKEYEKKCHLLKENTTEYIECILHIENLQQQIDDIGLNMVFDNFDIVGEKNGHIIGFGLYKDQDQNEILYNPATNVQITPLIQMDIANSLRKMNSYEKVKSKPGNDSAKKYLLEKERRKQKRNAKKKKEPYLEKMVIALVNTSEFPYDYDSCMNLSIYRFNQSFKQIQHKISFDNTMIGVYAGTVDTSKMSNKDALSWIPNK